MPHQHKILAAVFSDLLDREQIERYITLSCVSNQVGGDLVGRGPQGSRVIQRIRQLGWPSVRGNHEDYLLTFRRGTVRTPAFMPVGTYGTVKSVTPEEVAADGAENAVLAGLYRRKGDEIAALLTADQIEGVIAVTPMTSGA